MIFKYVCPNEPERKHVCCVAVNDDDVYELIELYIEAGDDAQMEAKEEEAQRKTMALLTELRTSNNFGHFVAQVRTAFKECYA